MEDERRNFEGTGVRPKRVIYRRNEQEAEGAYGLNYLSLNPWDYPSDEEVTFRNAPSKRDRLESKLTSNSRMLDQSKNVRSCSNLEFSVAGDNSNWRDWRNLPMQRAEKPLGHWPIIASEGRYADPDLFTTEDRWATTLASKFSFPIRNEDLSSKIASSNFNMKHDESAGLHLSQSSDVYLPNTLHSFELNRNKSENTSVIYSTPSMFARASQQSQPCLSSVVHERVKEPISVISAPGNYFISSTINAEIAETNRLPRNTNEFLHAEPWLYPRRIVETNESNDKYITKESDKLSCTKEIKPNEINSTASNSIVKESDPVKFKAETETADKKVMPISEGKANISSSSSHVEKPRQYIKMGTYNGKTSVDAFLRKFEVCSKNNGWSDDEKLNQLTCALTEPASQLLWEFDSNTVATWSDLVNKLRLRYGSSDQASLYQTQLNTRRQKEGEDLGSVAQDIRRLMILAYPGPTSTHSETIAIRSFLDALRDKELALKLREREPETLDSAYKLALRLEGYKKAEREETEHSDRRPGRIKAVKENDFPFELVRKLLKEELKEELEPQKQRLEQLEHRLNNGSNFTNATSAESGLCAT